MEIVPQIDRWLATGCDYDEGATLYARFGSSGFLKNYFVSTGLREVAGVKLKTELMALRAAQAPDQRPPKENSPPSAQDLPEQVNELNRQLKSLLAKIAARHGDLVNATTDGQRFEIAQELVDMSKRRKEIWYALDHWKATGQVPGRPSWERNMPKLKEVVSQLSPKEVVSRLLNIRSQITKAKQAAEKHSEDDNKREKYLAKLARLQQELELLQHIRDAQPIT